MSRAQLTSTVEQNTGGAVAPYVGGKNFVVNGGMDNWQRGTSVAVAASSSGYSADRWCAASQAANTAITISRQATSDTTNLPFIQYCSRVQRNSGQTGTGAILFVNSFESITAIPLASKTVTMSFYARAGANFSASGSSITSSIITGTGTDQNRALVGYTGEVAISGGATLTTTWQRFVVTGTVPATATEVATYFSYTPSGTAGANDYFEVTGVQIELGSVATPFSRAGGTLQGELALCQRYYERWNAAASGDEYCVGGAYNTIYLMMRLQYDVPKRVAPTINISSASHFTCYGNNAGQTPTTANANNINPYFTRFDVTGSWTTGYSYDMRANTTSAWIDFSAEL